MIQIENIKAPRPKYVVKDEERRNKVFRAFKNAYRTLYMIEADGYSVREDGFLIVKRGSQVIECASEKRIESLTRMMRNRINDRSGQ
jgi:hypothetical protein